MYPKNGIILACLVALWWASIALIALPNLGTSSSTFPVVISTERMLFFLGTAAVSATYSLYTGIKWLKS